MRSTLARALSLLWVASALVASRPVTAAAEGEAYKGPEIAWARSWTEAVEEAAERNVAIYVHSHGST